jgi:biopolymer transport protein ExbB
MWYLFAQVADKASEAAAKAGEAAKTAVEAAKTAAAPVAEKAAEAAANGADAAAATAGQKSWLYDLLHAGALGYMVEGGPFMWPILIMAVVMLGVIIERFRSLKMLGTDSGVLREDVLQLLRNERIEEALARCDREQGPVPAILSAGLRKFFVLRRLNYDAARIEEQVVKAMDDYSVHIVAALEKHLPILATIASAAPMLGFLGTVQGMVVAFADIEASIGTKNIVELAAAGIKVALLTTVFGLVVGLPAYVAFNYFNGVINRFVLDVEEAGTELIEAVTFHMALEGGAVGAAVPSPNQAYGPSDV